VLREGGFCDTFSETGNGSRHPTPAFAWCTGRLGWVRLRPFWGRWRMREPMVARVRRLGVRYRRYWSGRRPMKRGRGTRGPRQCQGGLRPRLDRRAARRALAGRTRQVSSADPTLMRDLRLRLAAWHFASVGDAPGGATGPDPHPGATATAGAAARAPPAPPHARGGASPRPVPGADDGALERAARDFFGAQQWGPARHCMRALRVAEWSIGGTPVDEGADDVFCAVALALVPALGFLLRHDARNLLALLAAATAASGDDGARPLREALPALVRALGDARATPAWARAALGCLGAAALEKLGHVARWTLDAWDRCARAQTGLVCNAARRDWWTGVRAELDPLRAAERWLTSLDRPWGELARWLLPAQALGALALTVDVASVAIARGALRYAAPSRAVLALAGTLRFAWCVARGSGSEYSRHYWALRRLRARANSRADGAPRSDR
jgi:hypothetical protein